jgi:MFS family permease
MHDLPEFSQSEVAASDGRKWYQMLTRYHWFVLIVAALGWLFDCLDQQLFILARPAAMRELLPELSDKAQFELSIDVHGYYATSIFMVGWAVGGLLFGVLGDRIGRAKVMIITILMYSLFTGLSALSVGFWDFALYRFLTGLGVGGEFAVGVALVAEVMPAAARSRCLALLQALSAIGNVSAAMINLSLGVAEEQGLVSSPWRIMFLVGAVPALLAVFIRRRLKEPERWEKASHEDVVGKQLGSYRELFRNPILRKHALFGLLLACSGVVGLWAVGFFTPDLIRSVQRRGVTEQVHVDFLEKAEAAGESVRVEQLKSLQDLLKSEGSVIPTELSSLQTEVTAVVNGRLSRWASYTSLMINFGAFFGMFGFGALAERIGRKPTFALALIAAFLSTASVCWFLKDFWQIFVLVPIMGFCQLSLFAGYAIYFPELFPTRLRSTGTSFCYNVGRFIAAGAPLISAQLLLMYGKQQSHNPANLRLTGVTMSLVFLIGLLALPFLPETKGKPLPE